MRPKLGQHFLINKNAIEKIIAALEISENETIIEIGPGKGALTLPLAKKCRESGCKIIAIEKDPQLGLRVEGLGDSKNLKIIIGDALKEIPKIAKPYTLNPIPYKIVGNIPYYITGKLLRILSELEFKPELAVLMVQKEVAERLAAKPPKMNLLAAAVQFWSKPEIILFLKPEDFSPRPEVDSAVIKLTEKPALLANPKAYYHFIHSLFKQPRKTIANNLGKGLKMPKKELEKSLASLKISPELRPQNLSLDEIKKLANLFTP